MGPIEQLAEAVLERDALRARSLVQDIHRARLDLSTYPVPSESLPGELRTMAAALADLLASRAGVAAPAWTQDGEKFPEPVYVSEFSLRSARHAAMCRVESPPELARRNVFAPREFLTVV